MSRPPIKNILLPFVKVEIDESGSGEGVRFVQILGLIKSRHRWLFRLLPSCDPPMTWIISSYVIAKAGHSVC